MSDMEERAWNIARGFWAKWRETVIETEEQWKAFAEEYAAVFAPVFDTPLGEALAMAVFDAFSRLYENGNKPMPANYFGRDDL